MFEDCGEWNRVVKLQMRRLPNGNLHTRTFTSCSENIMHSNGSGGGGSSSSIRKTGRLTTHTDSHCKFLVCKCMYESARLVAAAYSRSNNQRQEKRREREPIRIATTLHTHTLTDKQTRISILHIFTNRRTHKHTHFTKDKTNGRRRRSAVVKADSVK